MAVFRELLFLNVIFCFLTPKRRKDTSLHGNTSFDVLCLKIGSGALAVGRWKNQKRSAI